MRENALQVASPRVNYPFQKPLNLSELVYYNLKQNRYGKFYQLLLQKSIIPRKRGERSRGLKLPVVNHLKGKGVSNSVSNW